MLLTNFIFVRMYRTHQQNRCKAKETKKKRSRNIMANHNIPGHDRNPSSRRTGLTGSSTTSNVNCKSPKTCQPLKWKVRRHVLFHFLCCSVKAQDPLGIYQRFNKISKAISHSCHNLDPESTIQFNRYRRSDRKRPGQKNWLNWTHYSYKPGPAKLVSIPGSWSNLSLTTGEWNDLEWLSHRGSFF